MLLMLGSGRTEKARETERGAMNIEEWWGRRFERRGSVTVRNMPDSSPATIQKLSTEEVLELVRSENGRSVRGLAAQMEARRRENWTARVALAVAILALIVAAMTAIFGAG